MVKNGDFVYWNDSCQGFISQVLGQPKRKYKGDRSVQVWIYPLGKMAWVKESELKLIPEVVNHG